MAILSMRTRKRAWDSALSAIIIASVWILQVTVLNQFFFQGAICNLPLTVTILWGFVFGSPMPEIMPDELRKYSTLEVFFRQLLGGSISGTIIGGFFAALYSSVLPIFPLCFPLIGWIAGYFCPRKINRETLLCIPVVLLATVFAEFVMAGQLSLIGRHDAFDHLSRIALPEALLNSLIAPFVYFPMRHWYDFFQTETQS